MQTQNVQKQIAAHGLFLEEATARRLWCHFKSMHCVTWPPCAR